MPMPEGFLDPFVTQIFLETGFHRGDGTAIALKAGFGCVYSCDVSEFAYGWCSHRFRRQRDKVHLVLKDSREFLRDRIGGPVIPPGKFVTDLGQKSTFWLDAHWCGGNGEVGGTDGGRAEDHPLLEELAIIGTHPIRNHIILIDDVRMFDTPGWPTTKQVYKAIYAINPAYNIKFEDGLEFDRDIMVVRE